MSSAGDIKRQVTITVVVAMEEAALLGAGERVIGGIQIEDDAPGRPCVRVEEQLHKQRLNRFLVVPNPMIAPHPTSERLLQPVERRLAGNRRAALAARLELAREHGHHGIMAQMIVIVEVLVAERKAEQTLASPGCARSARAPVRR